MSVLRVERGCAAHPRCALSTPINDMNVREIKGFPDVAGGHTVNTILPICWLVSIRRCASAAPDLPAMGETLPGYEVRLWNGLFAPARTPPDIVDRIHRATVDALRSSEVKTRIAEQGSEPVGNTPAEFKAFLASELVKWRRLVEISGATVQ